MVDGVSTVSGLAKPGHIRSDAQALTPEIDEQGLIDLQTWMIDSTAVHAQPESLLAQGKKGGVTSLPITL